jgi:hypothetical protein
MNVGPDETVVFKSNGISSFNHPLGGPPREFGEPFLFDAPFEYDPNAGTIWWLSVQFCSNGSQTPKTFIG